MQLLLTSPDLTAPTMETLREYADRRFVKLTRFLPAFGGEHMVKVSVRRTRYLFEVVVEIEMPGKLIIHTKDKDMRKAIDDAYESAKKTIVRRRQKQRKR